MNADLKYNPMGLLVAMALCALVMLAADGCEAYAAPCRVCRVQQKVVVPYVAPQLAAYSPVQYMIGQGVRQQSVDTAAFRASAEYQEFIELRAWKAGLQYGEQLRGHADIPPQPWTPQPEKPSDAAADPSFPLPSPLPEQLPRGAEPDPAGQRYAGIMSTIVARCSKCHSGDEPKGDLWLDGSVDLTSVDATDKRDAIVRAALHGHMPPSGHKPLEDSEFTAILYELFPASSEP